jgi:hypothetical protein
MKRIRIVGTGLMMALALAAFAASASAQAPEFGRCVKVAKGAGSFKNGGCTEAVAGGSYEWQPGPPASSKFTLALKAGTIFTLETVGGSKITCSGESGSGEYASANTVSNVLLTFTGCQTSGGQVNSAGQPSGRVVMNLLEGALGVVKAGASAKQDKIGLDLFPEESGGPVAEMACGGLLFVVKGSLIVPVAANKMQLTSISKIAKTKGKQKPEQFEGEPKDILEFNVNGGPFEQAGFGLEVTRTNEEAIEINSVV